VSSEEEEEEENGERNQARIKRIFSFILHTGHLSCLFIAVRLARVQ